MLMMMIFSQSQKAPKGMSTTGRGNLYNSSFPYDLHLVNDREEHVLQYPASLSEEKHTGVGDLRLP